MFLEDGVGKFTQTHACNCPVRATTTAALVGISGCLEARCRQVRFEWHLWGEGCKHAKVSVGVEKDIRVS